MGKCNTSKIKALIPSMLSVLFGSLLFEQRISDINWLYLLITAGASAMLTWIILILPIKNKISRLFFLVLTACPLSSFFGWCAQSGFVSWRPAVASLPLFFLLVAVLFIDDLLCYDDDIKQGRFSLAHFLGAALDDRKWIFFGIFECFIDAYAALIILLIVGVLPPFALLPLALFLLLKELFVQIKKAAHEEVAFVDNGTVTRPILKKINSNVYVFYIKFSFIISLGLVFDKIYILLRV